MSIRIKQLNKYYGDYQALQNINLQVPTGSLTALLGPSGCGKTTLLRIIAGLERADSGELFLLMMRSVIFMCVSAGSGLCFSTMPYSDI